MKKYYYELFDKVKAQTGKGYKIKCRVFKLDQTQIEVFGLIVDENGKYEPWTGDIITPKPWRYEIANELNESINKTA